MSGGHSMAFTTMWFARFPNAHHIPRLSAMRPNVTTKTVSVSIRHTFCSATQTQSRFFASLPKLRWSLKRHMEQVNTCGRCVHQRSTMCYRLGAIGRNVVKYSTKPGKSESVINVKVQKLAKTSAVKRLLSLAKPEKWRLSGAICLLLISSAVTMVVPFGIGRVIDIIYTPDDTTAMIPRLKRFCQILLVVFVIGALANFGRVYLMQLSGNRIVKSIRQNLFSSIIRQEIAFFDRTKTGELINRLSADTALVGQSVTMNISDGLRSITQACAGISMMVYMSPILAAIALCIVPPVALLSRVYGRYVQRITKQVQDALAASTQVAEERLSNMRTVRAFVKEDREEELYTSSIEKVLQLSRLEALSRGVFWATTGLSGNLIVLSVIYYGGIMMSDAQITVGELSSFLLYAAFVGVSIGGLSTFYTEMMRGLGASSRLWELIDKKPEIPCTGGILPLAPPVGDIELRDVFFNYPTRPDMSVFSGLSLRIPSGSVMAIVGGSGCGKSTLASLLLRYYDCEQGDIYIDGMKIKDLNTGWLRNCIGIVSQEPTLFSCSIEDNILYGADAAATVSRKQVIDAAKMANAYNFISAFPDGFDTLVGERGIMLSGGQKQRIAIARAIVKNPKILIFDEATSALDAESEHLVQEALERMTEGRTVITIAHRLSTIRHADSIALLHNGQVAEVGSYTQLMNTPDGQFRRLVERQMMRGADSLTNDVEHEDGYVEETEHK